MECLIHHKHTLKILYNSKHFPPRYNRKREWVFLLSESHKHTLKILCKSKHFPRRYERKREWVFFSEHSVYFTTNKHWNLWTTNEVNTLNTDHRMERFHTQAAKFHLLLALLHPVHCPLLGLLFQIHCPSLGRLFQSHCQSCHSALKPPPTQQMRHVASRNHWNSNVTCKQCCANIRNEESNSYFSIRFDSKREQLYEIFDTYHHWLLTYVTEWRRFFNLATTPSNQQNLLLTMVQELYLLEIFILTHYGPPSTETPTTTTVRYLKNQLNLFKNYFTTGDFWDQR